MESIRSALDPSPPLDFLPLIENSGDYVVAFDRDWRYIFVNSESERQIGKPREELLGRVIWELFPAARNGAFYDSLQRAMQERITVTQEAHSDILNNWFELRCFPLPESAGGGIIAHFRDISARNRAEQELKAITDSLPAIVWRSYADGNIAYCNQRFYGYTGLSQADLSEDIWPAIVHPDDLPQCLDVWISAQQDGAPWQCEYRLRRFDGEYRWHLGRSLPIHEASGRLTMWVGSATDIHERKQMEAAQQFLTNLVEQTSVLHDADAVVREVCRRTGEYLNVARCSFSEIDEERDTAVVWCDWAREGLESAVGSYMVSPFGEAITGTLRSRQTIAIPDTNNDPRISAEVQALVRQMKVCAGVTVPIVQEGKLVGSLTVSNDTPRDWTPEEIELLEQIAQRTWLAVENAQLWRKLEEDRAQQTRVAESLQRSLLIRPELMDFDRVDVYAVYEPAADEDQIGGDLYDAFMLEGGKMALVVGDSTGKGLAASADCADIKFSLRAFLRQDAEADPVQAMRRMNQHIRDLRRLDGKSESLLLCLTLAVVDPERGEAMICGAGMEPPVLLNTRSGEVQVLTEAGGPILGLLTTWEGSSEQIPFTGDEVLFLYTDGIPETRRNGRGKEFFDVAGVVRALKDSLPVRSLEHLSRAVIRDAKAFAAADSLGDDVCLLAARRKPE